MRTVLLSDVHGNAVALRRCLAHPEVLRADAVHCLGDVVGYYPDAHACLSLLDEVEATMISGNHEAMLTGRLGLDPARDEVYRLAELRSHLSASVLARLAALPDRREVELGGRRALLVHGSPTEPLTGRIGRDDELGHHLAGTDAEVVVVANTHRPFVRRHEGTIVVNVGSVGMPRDIGTSASFVVHEPGRGFEVVRVRLELHEVRRAYPEVHPDVHAMLQRNEAR